MTLQQKQNHRHPQGYDVGSSFWAGAYGGFLTAVLFLRALVAAGLAAIFGRFAGGILFYVTVTLVYVAIAALLLRFALWVIGAMVAVGASKAWRAVGLEDEMLYVAGLMGSASVTVLSCPIALLVSEQIGNVDTALFFLPVAATCQLGAILGASQSEGFQDKPLLADLTNFSFPIRHLFVATAVLSFLLWWIKWLGLPVGWVYGLGGLMIGGQVCSLVMILWLRSMTVRLWNRLRRCST
ncbi:MAG: hypothetical protein AAGA92_15175 [Planctomycetota bacterium]